MAQAENVRTQLQRTMERFDIDLVSTQDERKLYTSIRKLLVCGYFMQIAHREGEENGYLTMKDNQVCLAATYRSMRMLMHVCEVVNLHPSCGLNISPEWVLFNEFLLTTRPYIRTVSIVDPAWCVSLLHDESLDG